MDNKKILIIGILICLLLTGCTTTGRQEGYNVCQKYCIEHDMSYHAVSGVWNVECMCVKRVKDI